MIEKQSFPDQHIIDCLNHHYGIEAVSLKFLPLGVDMNASVYEAKAKDQSSYFIKLKRGYFPDISLIIPTLLNDAGIQQIIPPIKTIHGQLCHLIGDFTIIAYPYIKGQDGFTQHLTEDQFIVLGQVMRQVHEYRLPKPVQDLVRREEFSPKWWQAVRSLCAHIDSELITDEPASMLRTVMKVNMTAIQRLLDGLELLSKKIREQHIGFVLCHSDIHAGNVLIDKNSNLFIVDWDEPIMAPKERDLMFIGGGVGNVWNVSNEEEFFYKGYGKTEVNKTLLAYYRHERIVEDIAVYGEQLFHTSLGGQDRMEAYHHFVAQFAPQGVVEIAFQTDEGVSE